MTPQINPLTLPQQQPRRTRSLNIRLTEQERAAIETLAAQQGLAPSQMARHFLMQAVAFYLKQFDPGA